jgi:hypothetical protein
MATFTRLVPAPPPERRAYPSDLTDAQWRVLEPLLRDREPGGPGRPPTVHEVGGAAVHRGQAFSSPHGVPAGHRCGGNGAR